MGSREIVLWLDERWHDALSKHLKDETLEEHLENVLDEMCNQLPRQEYERISALIWQEGQRNKEAAEAARRFAVFHVTERGESACFLVEESLEMLQAAVKLRSYLRKQSVDSTPRFLGMFSRGERISVEQFNAYVQERLANTGRVTGAFDIDLDNGTFDALHIVDGWQRFSIPDISTATYYATKKSYASEESRTREFLKRLEGKELLADNLPVYLKGKRQLQEKDISFAEEIIQNDHLLEFYMETGFDVDKPLTDFWRVGRGYAKKLEANGLYTMGDIARCSIGKPGEQHSEELLYKLFGVNAELLIDHAWGWEPCTIAEIKAYKPQSNSIGSGQVLKEPYPYDKAKLVVWEMADLLSLDLVDKGLVTKQLVLTVGYDRENLKGLDKRRAYRGEVTTDYYGRAVPKHAHGTENLKRYTASTEQITQAVMELFTRIVDPELLVRRVYLTATHVVTEQEAGQEEVMEQLDLFTDHAAEDAARKEGSARERKRQETILAIKKKYGKTKTFWTGQPPKTAMVRSEVTRHEQKL